MAYQNPYYVPVSVDGLSSGNAQPPKPAASSVQAEPSMNPVERAATKVLQYTQTPASEDKSFLRKVGEDAAAIGAGIPIAISHPLRTLKSIFTTPETPIGGATVESIKQTVDKQYYKDHPLLAVVNAGSWVSTVFDFGLSTVAQDALKTGIKTGIENAALDAAGHAAVEAALTSGAVKATLKKISREAIKTGEYGVVKEVASNALVRKGLTQEAADSVGQGIVDGLSGKVAKSATIKPLLAGAHPLSTLGRKVGEIADPIVKAVFGDAPNTAVGRIYGVGEVAKNPEGFLNVERWAGQQAVERGLKNTVNNRERIMNDWSSTVSEWSLLSPPERVKYHENYVAATDAAREVGRLTGDELVPTKFLTPTSVKAISSDIADADAKINAEAVLKQLLEDHPELAIHEQTLQRVVSETPTRDALVSAVESLGRGQSLSYKGMPEVEALIRKLEKETGYTVEQAPQGKRISFAEAVPNDTMGGAIPTSDNLVAAKSRLGKMVDRLGLSADQGIDGSLETLFQDQFSQNVVKRLSPKYGEIAKVESGNGTRNVPLERLYEFVMRNKKTIVEGRQSGITNALQGLPQNIVDFTAKDYASLGFSPGLAKDLAETAKSTLQNLPWQKTGLAAGVTNLLRARFPGFADYLKTSYHTRFNLNPFYAFQEFVEMQTNVAMALKDPKSIARGHVFGHAVDSRLATVVSKIPYLKDIVAPQLTFKDIKLFEDEVLSDLGTNYLDSANNPELSHVRRAAQGLDTAKGRAAFNQSVQSDNVFLRAFGWHMHQSATALGRSLAEKYGFSLEDALKYSVKDGNKVYDHPAVANAIKETTQSVFSYKPGFLTSPLAKTLNVVWFPFRFQAKTVQGLAKWVGGLSPTGRMAVMTGLNHFSSWAASDEGVAWRRKNSDLNYAALNYIFAYESAGQAVDAAMRGKLFGGNTGHIGGMPFGVVIDILRDLGLYATDPENYSTVTGRRFTQRAPKKLLSLQAATTVVEDLIANVIPSMPFYALTAGNASSFSGDVKNKVEGMAAAAYSQITQGSAEKATRQFQKGFTHLPLGTTRFGQ